MRDKITKAIDALASAAFIEGGVSAEKTQTARDLTEQRKRELVEAISSPCLHQISEPSVNQQLTVAPVAAMTNALREAEAALEVALARILKADPGHSTSVTSEAKALVAVRQALSAKAAPVAVGEREAFERELIDNHHYVPSDFSFKDGFYGGDDDYIQFGWDIWQARAALAATPAEPRHEAAVILEAIAQEPPINGNEIAKARTLMAARALRAATQAAVPAIPKWIDDPHDIEQGQMLNPEWVKLQETTKPEDHSEQVLDMVAAPVVLPEPVGAIAWNRDGERPTFHAGCTNKELLRLKLNEGLTGGPYRTEFAFTEPQLRALLATGGQAQAVASIYVTEDGQREVDDWRAPLPVGRNLLYAAPQAQADQRDANVQWWLAEIDQYGNPALTDGAHSDRSGADKAAYLINAIGLSQGRKFSVARVELSDPKPSAEGVNHEAIAQNNLAAIAAAKEQGQ